MARAGGISRAAYMAMRLVVVVGCSMQSRATTALTLGLELEIPSIEAIAAGCRARIWAKGSTMRTSLSRVLVQTPNAAQENLDEISADLAEAPLTRKCAPIVPRKYRILPSPEANGPNANMGT